MLQTTVEKGMLQTTVEGNVNTWQYRTSVRKSVYIPAMYWCSHTNYEGISWATRWQFYTPLISQLQLQRTTVPPDPCTIWQHNASIHVTEHNPCNGATSIHFTHNTNCKLENHVSNCANNYYVTIIHTYWLQTYNTYSKLRSSPWLIDGASFGIENTGAKFSQLLQDWRLQRYTCGVAMHMPDVCK